MNIIPCSILLAVRIATSPMLPLNSASSSTFLPSPLFFACPLLCRYLRLLFNPRLSLHGLQPSLTPREQHQLPQHPLPHLLRQAIHILRFQPLRFYRLEHYNRYPPCPKPPLLNTQHAPIVRAHNRHDRHLCSDSQMKRSFLKPPQKGPGGITPRALRKDKDALPRPPHLLRRPIKSLDGTIPVRAVDEDSSRQRHEPP